MQINTLIVFLLLSLTGSFALAEEPEPPFLIRLAYSEVAAPPYQIAHTRHHPGLAFDIINQALQELGIGVEYVAMPNKRVLLMLEQNAVDGAFMYSFKTQRMRHGVYPMQAGHPNHALRIAELTYYLYRRADSDAEWDGKSFVNHGLIVGANTGYSIANDVRSRGVRVQEAATTEQNFSKLRLGRIDAFAHQDLVADRYLERAGMSEDFIKVEPPLSRKDYFLLFSQAFIAKHPQLAERIWQRIAAVRDEITQARLSDY